LHATHSNGNNKELWWWKWKRMKWETDLIMKKQKNKARDCEAEDGVEELWKGMNGVRLEL
jgi:hypothetical protein